MLCWKQRKTAYGFFFFFFNTVGKGVLNFHMFIPRFINCVE